MSNSQKAASRTYEEQARVFYIALANAFMSEEDQSEIPQIQLDPDAEFGDTVCAMLAAMQILLSNMSSTFDADDLIEFTHILNRIVFQRYLSLATNKAD